MVNLIKSEHKAIGNTQPLLGKLGLLHDFELMRYLDEYDHDDESEQAVPRKQKQATLLSLFVSNGKECKGGSQMSNTDSDIL